MKRGRLITLEGGEGVGKTSHLRFIQKLLIENNLPVVVTREPGGTGLAEKIRQLLITTATEPLSKTAELLLIFAARAQHIEQVIQPALTQGQWVLCDRFTDSTYAYQGGGRQLKQENIDWLTHLVQSSLEADLTLLLDAPVETGMMRVHSRGALDRFETENFIFFNHVRDVFLNRAHQFPQRIKVIDASLPLTDVQAQIKFLMDSFLC